MNSVFEANPEVEELIVFEDGNCFLITDKSLAELHKKNTGLEYKIVTKETKSKKTK